VKKPKGSKLSKKKQKEILDAQNIKPDSITMALLQKTFTNANRDKKKVFGITVDRNGVSPEVKDREDVHYPVSGVMINSVV